ncbi:MAG: TauD/TfdA family dioxygenase [Bradymonadaceae bacterium]|nr:TauD/TfdA family dioxygenase [Lujinxingiaceae bacterium]
MQLNISHQVAPVARELASKIIVQKALKDEAELRRLLARDGFIYLPGWNGAAQEMAASFGSVLNVTDVEAKAESNALVTSRAALDVHTDHSRARYILWHCLEQSEAGGVSILVDTRHILEAMSDEDRSALHSVYLTEHQVFRDDTSRVPLLREIKGQERIYYSFWLLEDELLEASRSALMRFRSALDAAPRRELRLQPGDVLVIDNHRVLHGRTAISGQGRRHLVRYWIGEERAVVAQSVKPSKERRGPKCPPPIQPCEVQQFIEQGVDPAVAAIDLSMVKMKMQDPEEGKGWSQIQCDEVELEYKRYLTLNLRHADKPIVPTAEMDTMWHYHILDTRAYHADSQRVFGEYFHHFPYFGMRSDDDEADLSAAFKETCTLYRQEFGEDLLRAADAQSCWHDCQGRCWHACQS